MRTTGAASVSSFCTIGCSAVSGRSLRMRSILFLTSCAATSADHCQTQNQHRREHGATNTYLSEFLHGFLVLCAFVLLCGYCFTATPSLNRSRPLVATCSS